jgi:hypothetical protein
MDVKKTVKWDGKLKGLHFEGNELIDENGEVIDLNKHMKAAYGDKTFALSVTAKEEEIVEIFVDEEDEE